MNDTKFIANDNELIVNVYRIIVKHEFRCMEVGTMYKITLLNCRADTDTALR